MAALAVQLTEEAGAGDTLGGAGKWVESKAKRTKQDKVSRQLQAAESSPSRLKSTGSTIPPQGGGCLLPDGMMTKIVA